MGFGERLKSYTKLMGVTQRFVADLIGDSEQTLTNWGRGVNPPAVKLLKLADATGATIDWWLGRTVMTMWGFDIQHMQLAVREMAPHIEATDLVDRCVKVIELCVKNSETCAKDWFMPGVCGLSAADFNRLLMDKDDLSPITLGRLAEFTCLHEDWLMDGDLDALNRQVDLGAYHHIARRWAEDDIKPEELEANYEPFRRRIIQQRNMLKMPAEKE